MPFSARELSVLAYANGFTLWHYRTADPLAALIGRGGYFAAADELLRPGDQVLVTLDGADFPSGAALVVAAVAPEVIVAPCAAPALNGARSDASSPMKAAASENAAAGLGGWN